MSLREKCQIILERRAVRNEKNQEIKDPTSEAIEFVRGSSRIIHPDQVQLPDGLDSSRPWRVSKYGIREAGLVSHYRVGFQIPRVGDVNEVFILRTTSNERVGTPVAVLCGGENFMPITDADNSERQIYYNKVYEKIVSYTKKNKSDKIKKRSVIFGTVAAFVLYSTFMHVKFNQIISNGYASMELAEQEEEFDKNYQQGLDIPLIPPDLASSEWNLAGTIENGLGWVPLAEAEDGLDETLFVKNYELGTLRALNVGKEACKRVFFGAGGGKLELYNQPGEALTFWADSPDDGSITICTIGPLNDDKKEHSVIFKITQ